MSLKANTSVPFSPSGHQRHFEKSYREGWCVPCHGPGPLPPLSLASLSADEMGTSQEVTPLSEADSQAGKGKASTQRPFSRPPSPT